jgi:hypothetical protein
LDFAALVTGCAGVLWFFVSAAHNLEEPSLVQKP